MFRKTMQLLIIPALSIIAIISFGQNPAVTKFNQLRFHDFVLSQGILPPALIKQAVMEEFVTKEK